MGGNENDAKAPAIGLVHRLNEKLQNSLLSFCKSMQVNTTEIKVMHFIINKLIYILVLSSLKSNYIDLSDDMAVA